MEGVASATPFFLMLFFNLKNVGAVNHAANGAHCRGGFYARPKKSDGALPYNKIVDDVEWTFDQGERSEQR